MKNKFLFTVILTSLCLLLFIVKTFAQEGFNTQTFKVSKSGNLRVDLSGGDIQIKTGNNNEVKVSNEEDEGYSSVSVYQDGNDITVKSDDYVDFIITVPNEFNLSLNTSGGDINVLNNIKGKVKVNTAGGDINLKEVNGELTASTAGGNITSGNVTGNVKLSSGGGDVFVGKVEGSCIVSTGGGNVTVDNVTKSLNVTTGGGNIDCKNIGSTVKIISGGGNISVDKISGAMTLTTGGGDVNGISINKGGEVTTGGGNVNLKNISDFIIITTGAGDITAEFKSVGGSKSNIQTGTGNITVYLPENAKATIVAQVKWADVWETDKQDFSEYIHSDFKSTQEEFREGEVYAVYEVNGGGTRIDLETSLGDIQIKKLKR